MKSRTSRPRPGAAGVLVAGMLSVAASAPALAQGSGGVAHPVVRPVGTEVRVFAPRVLEGTPAASPWFVGRLVDADSAGVTLRTAAGATVTIPRDLAREFSVRAGPVERARSLGEAALFGAALGLLAGKLSAPPDSPSSAEPGKHMRNGALVGLAAGVLFGTFNPWHRWRKAPLPTATGPVEPD